MTKKQINRELCKLKIVDELLNEIDNIQTCGRYDNSDTKPSLTRMKRKLGTLRKKINESLTKEKK